MPDAACRTYRAVPLECDFSLLRKISLICLSDNQTAGILRSESQCTPERPVAQVTRRKSEKQQRSVPMEQSHVSALQLKHQGLERAIHDEMNRPAPDLTHVQALKKRKLRIKEELAHP